jgi:hypothetical protein
VARPGVRPGMSERRFGRIVFIISDTFWAPPAPALVQIAWVNGSLHHDLHGHEDARARSTFLLQILLLDRGLYRPLTRTCAAVALACLALGAARPAPLILGLALGLLLAIPWVLAVAYRLASEPESPGSGDDHSPAGRQALVRFDRAVQERDMALDYEQIIRSLRATPAPGAGPARGYGRRSVTRSQRPRLLGLPGRARARTVPAG